MTRSANRFQQMLERVNDGRGLRLLVSAFVAVVIVFAGVAIANTLLPGRSIKDYAVWLDTGQRMLHGAPIYPDGPTKFPFMYPPAAAALLAPVSLLGTTGLVVVLAAITAFAWFACIRLSVHLAASGSHSRNLLVNALPSLFVIVFVWANFHIGQPSLVLLALLLGAFAALQAKRQILAGALVALAAGIKAFPLIAIVYLLYRRYWTAAVSLCVSLVLLVLLLPAAFRGMTNARADVQRWTSGMLLKYDENGVAQRPGRSHSWKNQSIFGLTNRLLRHVDADDQPARHTPVYVNVADLSFRAVNCVIAAIALLLGIGYIAVMPRRDARTRETDAIEFALFILLMLIFTPFSYGYLYVFLLYPFTVCVTRLIARPNRLLLIATGIAVCLLILSIPAQITAQLYGNYFFASVALFIALAADLWHLKRMRPDETHPIYEPAGFEKRAGGGD